jgi:hypothetical protein
MDAPMRLSIVAIDAATARRQLVVKASKERKRAFPKCVLVMNRSTKRVLGAMVLLGANVVGASASLAQWQVGRERR